ncbi:MAG TPA: histidine phosphatase family protein [Chitinophagales bacterium]|nr:histidine phosphatase family protein [Chitinophagales bacterium]
MKKEIYIIRHGETDLNKQGIVQGRGVDSHLNALGKRQAAAFFEHFSHEGFEIIYTSALTRTKQTVQPFADEGYSIYHYPELDEISWGIYEGKLPDSAASREYMAMLKKWRSGILDERIPGGESPRELQLRQLRFLDDILKHSVEKKILICSHGRAIRSLLCTMLGDDLSRMDDYPHQNLSLYKLIYNSHGFELVWFNYTAHLKGI